MIEKQEMGENLDSGGTGKRIIFRCPCGFEAHQFTVTKYRLPPRHFWRLMQWPDDRVFETIQDECCRRERQMLFGFLEKPPPIEICLDCGKVVDLS